VLGGLSQPILESRAQTRLNGSDQN